MNQKILVTGGAGYIGGILSDCLLQAGYHVTVIDNFMYRQASLGHLCAHPNFELIEGDIRKPDVLKPALRSADVIIPLAAYVGAPLCMRDPVGATSVNRDAALLLFSLLHKDQAVLMPTTNSAYGSGAPGEMFDETSPLKPISLYAREKVEVENALMQHENAISFRLATVFGMAPRMRLDLLVNDFTWRALNDRFIVVFEGSFKRNYLHVRDVAAAFMHGIKNFNDMRGNIYNVGLSDANLSKIELCQRIQKQVPDFFYHEAPLAKDPDQRNYIVSNDKISATGFLPAYSLDDGIRELIKGFAMLRPHQHRNA